VSYMNSRERFIEEQRDYHISVWLQTELGYDDDQIDLFWSNINGLVDIDLKERFFTND
jgi:hypothetical protein